MPCSRSAGGACSGGVPAPGGSPAPGGVEETPPGQETATVVDGTHPTGMHSCYVMKFDQKKKQLSLYTYLTTRWIHDFLPATE